MRIEPVVGQKLWFKPRGWGGWGWTPASWEGWAVVVGSLVAYLVIGSLTRGATTAVCIIATTLVLVVVGVLKGTEPGGPQKRREFDRLNGR